MVLADEDREPGGRLLAEGVTGMRASSPSERRGAGVEVLAGAPALGCFDGLVPVWQGDTLHQVAPAGCCSRPARSSSRWSSPATISRG